MTGIQAALLIVGALAAITTLNTLAGRSYWRQALWISMLAILILLVWSSRRALIPFAIGGMLAYILTPAVDRVAAFVPVTTQRGDAYRRGLAVLVIYLALGGAWVGVGILVVPPAADQITEFADTVPELVNDAETQFADWLDLYHERVPEDAREIISGYKDGAVQALQDSAASTARRSVSLLTGTIEIVFGFIIVPFWLFYALRDRHRASRKFWNAMPEGARADVQNLVAMADRLLGRYLRGQLMLGVIVGIAVSTGLVLLDVQLAIALGVFAGFTELIPIIGPWIGVIPAIVIVAATDPDKIIWVALLYLAVQQLENNFLVPRVQGQAMDLHPAMVILLLVIGGSVFGFLGLIVVVPIAAMLREFFWYADHRLRGRSPDEAILETHVGRGVAEQRSGEAERASAMLEPSPPEDGAAPQVVGQTASSGSPEDAGSLPDGPSPEEPAPEEPTSG